MLQNTIFIADYTEQIVRIRSFSGPYFPAFELNADQKNSKYGHFSRSTKYKYWSENSLEKLNQPSNNKKPGKFHTTILDKIFS